MDARYGRPNMSQRQGIPSTATNPGAARTICVYRCSRECRQVAGVGQAPSRQKQQDRLTTD